MDADGGSAAAIRLDAAKGGPRLTDPKWALLEPLLPLQARLGRPWTHPLRAIMDAILHLMRTGGAWSALPDWAPPHSVVYEWFRRLADGGCLEQLNHALRPRLGGMNPLTGRALSAGGFGRFELKPRRCIRSVLELF